MIDGPKPYAEMKDSGVPWLGEVPEQWTVQKLRHCVSVLGGLTPSMEERRFWNGAIPWVTPKDMKRPTIGDSITRVSEDALRETSLRLIQAPAVLIVVRGMILARRVPVASTSNPVTVNQDMKAMIPVSGVNPHYLRMVLESAQSAFVPMIDEAGHGTRRLPTERWRELPIVVPPAKEQAAIVRFLDHADRRSRRYIRAKQKLIKLLEEQKQAIIHRAVTRGLDPNVRLKPSGVEWLGDVPEHWEVRRVKSLSLVKRGASPRPIADPKYFDNTGEYAWVRIADVSASTRYLERTTQRLSSLGDSLSVRLEPGALFLSIAGSVGKPIITKIKCCIHDGFVYFPQLRGNVEFLCRIFSSGAPFGRLGKLGTQLNLNTDTVGGICVGWPPASEQAAIAAYLDEATASFERATASAVRGIDLVQELRTRLISDVVTGKLDVRETAARLADEVDEPEPLDDIEPGAEADVLESEEVPEEAEA